MDYRERGKWGRKPEMRVSLIWGDTWGVSCHGLGHTVRGEGKGRLELKRLVRVRFMAPDSLTVWTSVQMGREDKMNTTYVPGRNGSVWACVPMTSFRSFLYQGRGGEGFATLMRRSSVVIFWESKRERERSRFQIMDLLAYFGKLTSAKKFSVSSFSACGVFFN